MRCLGKTCDAGGLRSGGRLWRCCKTRDRMISSAAVQIRLCRLSCGQGWTTQWRPYLDAYPPERAILDDSGGGFHLFRLRETRQTVRPAGLVDPLADGTWVEQPRSCQRDSRLNGFGILDHRRSCLGCHVAHGMSGRIVRSESSFRFGVISKGVDQGGRRAIFHCHTAVTRQGTYISVRLSPHGRTDARCQTAKPVSRNC
jgi:hypothetical protein